MTPNSTQPFDPMKQIRSGATSTPFRDNPKEFDRLLRSKVPKELYDDMQEHIDAFEKIRYDVGNNYPSYSDFITEAIYGIRMGLLNACMLSEQNYPMAADKSNTTFGTLTRFVLFDHPPVYRVSKQLAEAISAIEVPDDLNLGDLVWPAPSFVFFFENSLTEGGWICFDHNEECAEDYLIKEDQLSLIPAEIRVDNMAVFNWIQENGQKFGFEKRGVSVQFFMPTKNPKRPLVGGVRFSNKTPIREFLAMAAKFSGAEVAFSLALKILMYWNSEPQDIEPSRLERRIKGKVRGTKTEVFSPNIIGNRLLNSHEESQRRTGISPRIHWRRSHYRRQPHGEGRLLRKIVRVKGHLVSVDNHDK